MVWSANDHAGRHSLLWTTISVLRVAIIRSVIPRLCLIGFKYSQPFLISRAVEFANRSEEDDSIGWGLTGAVALVFMGLAVSNGAYYHSTYRYATSLRGCLVTLIYGKTVDLSITALDESIAITLMTNDTETACEGLRNAHELWAVPVEVAIALYILQIQLGIAFLAPAAVALISIGGILGLSRYVGRAQSIWIKGIQTRVDSTVVMLTSMKAVKMLGYTDLMHDIIQRLRERELQLSTAFRKLLCARVFLARLSGSLSPVSYTHLTLPTKRIV